MILDPVLVMGWTSAQEYSQGIQYIYAQLGYPSGTQDSETTQVDDEMYLSVFV